MFNIFNKQQPPEERKAHQRFMFSCGNRCACQIDNGPDQVVVDGLLISCICASEEDDDAN
jgi:hypothetical protein